MPHTSKESWIMVLLSRRKTYSRWISSCILDVHPTGITNCIWDATSSDATSSSISATFFHISIIKRSSIQAFSWVTIQRFSVTVRSLLVQSVLPGKMIVGVKISPNSAMVRTTATHKNIWLCFSQPDVLAATDLEALKKIYRVPYRWKLAFHPCYRWVLEDNIQSLKIWHTSLKNQKVFLSTV